MSLAETLTWPFFEEHHRRFAEELARWADATLPGLPHDDVDEGLPRARRGARQGRIPQGLRAGRIRRAASEARRAHALHRARDAGIPRRARGFRRRHAGARHRLDHALRLAGAEAALPAARARRQGDRGLRALRAGGRFGCCRDGDHRDARRQRPCAHRRREDLDFQRRHRGPLRGVRAHRRRPGREGALRLHGRCRHARPHGCRAHRRDRAASARDAEVRCRPRAGDQSPGRAGRGLQGRDGDARYLPLDRRRGRARLRAPRAA